LNVVRRSVKRPSFFVITLLSWLLVGCTMVDNFSWPGLTTDGQHAYVAYGPGIVAYDVEAREVTWVYAPDPGRVNFFAVPSLADGRLIIGDYGAPGGFIDPSVTVTIYALENGSRPEPAVLWTKSDLAKDRIVAPALQVGNRVFIGTADNQLLALDAETGEMLWPESFQSGHSIWGSPTYKDVSFFSTRLDRQVDGVLFITSLDRSVYALEAETGELLWQRTLGGAIASQAIVNDGLVYVSSFARGVHALSIETGEEQWLAPADDWVWGAPVLDNNTLYFASAQGDVHAIDARTGEELWRQEILGAIQTTPAIHGDMLYIASERRGENGGGLLTALSLSDNGRQVWQNNTPDPLYTTPVVVGDSVVVALQSDNALLIGFNLETGVQQWILPPPDL
jgi:eukaryotic-like serine/threonine-protein kinase